MRDGRCGFTLIELLVVIAIIAILAAILFPVFVSTKEVSHRSACCSNLKQIGTALFLYTDDNNGRFPYSYHPTSPTFWAHKGGTNILFYDGRAQWVPDPRQK